MKKSFWRETAWIYSPLLLCAVIMIPRLLSPQFGFFDDANSLTTAQRVWAGQWHVADEISHGRFRPVYWLFYAALYRLFGLHPFWYFLCNLLIFMGITFCLIRLGLALGLNRVAAWVAGLTFAVAGPVLENVYTLSKPELLQCFLILLVLLTCTFYTRMKAWYWKIAGFLLSALFALVACLIKETGILIAPAAFCSAGITWFWFRMSKQPDHPAVKQHLAFWWVSLTGVAVYFLLHTIYLNIGLASRAYASQFNLSSAWLVPKFRLWLDWLIRDYLYLVPIGIVGFVILLRKSKRDLLPLLIELLVWTVLWLGVYIPWIYTQEYYLLPLALGVALICGIFFSLSMQLMRGASLTRIAAVTGFILSIGLFVLTFPNQVTNGRLQLATDRANADMLAYVVEHAPRGSTVWINIQASNEYTDEFTHWVTQLRNRPDLKVEYFHFQDLAAALEQSAEVWIVSPFMENQFYPSVRVGMSELPSREWNASLEKYLAGRGELVGEVRESFRSSNLDPLRFFCPLARSFSYCKVPNAPLDQRTFAYGWKIIRVP